MFNYWLFASSLSVSMVGFVSASFHLGQYPCHFPKNASGWRRQQLMTTLLLGDGLELSAMEVDQMWERREMPPRIEPRYLGDAIDKWWHYTSTRTWRY
ncbi:hypothetical protein BKA56DRAFT_93329 [Ilyonectria sp. MPI-CAGE-AT-0026]|nr:hypothetical protein BKA56DRAFT_93329 [Ilyonectria sp. MPI-CAGE-AT-0026]